MKHWLNVSKIRAGFEAMVIEGRINAQLIMIDCYESNMSAVDTVRILKSKGHTDTHYEVCKQFNEFKEIEAKS